MISGEATVRVQLWIKRGALPKNVDGISYRVRLQELSKCQHSPFSKPATKVASGCDSWEGRQII